MTNRPPHELTAFLEACPQPQIVIDGDYRIVVANDAYLKQFSPDHPIVGRKCHEVSHGVDVPCDQAGESCPLARARETGRRERVLHVHHTPQGDAYVDIELTPVSRPTDRPQWFVERMDTLRGAMAHAASRGLIGRSAPFRAMLQSVARVGPSDASVLLLGESGTGKELIAKAVHEASRRAERPLVVVDCASLAETLFESELFGHERGAFTGASSSRAGLVEAANGGTLFLDEVGDIPLTMQVKLLRLLETGTYRRVGSTELRHADLRLISATHRNLSALVEAGRFREDLYFRLSTFPIPVPPLRERLDDLPLLAAALLARVSPRRRLSIAAPALDRLATHAFPGNVRELRNVLERAALLTDGSTIEPEIVERALHPLGAPGAGTPARAPAAPPRPQGTLNELADDALRARLAAHGGSREELARSLGISERTLYRRLKRLEDPPPPR